VSEYSCAITRRRFGFSLCGLPLSSLLPVAAQTAAPQPWDEPALVARAYLTSPQVHWPRPTLDVAKEVAEVDARLTEVERKHPSQFRFTAGQTLKTDADIEVWAKTLRDVDAVLLIPVSTPSVSIPKVLDAAGVPGLCFSRPYAGHHWSSIANLRKSGRRVDILATSSYGDLDQYAPVFRTIRHLRKSKMIVAADNTGRYQGLADGFGRQFGTSFEFMGYGDLKTAFDRANASEAQRAADEFTRNALRVVEPSSREIHDALRFYLAVQDIMGRVKANALTVDCFPGLLAKKMPAYPCISWSQLNDRGLYGVCEGDIRSTMTQILVTGFSGMPGFVSDPVFDTSRNEVIHAHCVAATRMKGIRNAPAPYLIRNHLETNEGAVLQVLMPVGETITVAEFADPRKVLVSTAEVTGTTSEVTGSPDADGGCRSKIRTRVTDAQKWLENYSAGLHRVIFYGDHVAAIERMGRLLGYEVIREV
jgi:hypothetical protein